MSMGQEEVKIILTAIDNSSKAIKEVTQAIYETSAATEEATAKSKALADAQKQQSYTTKDLIYNISALGTSLMSLYTSYDRIKDSSLYIDRANLRLSRNIETLIDLQTKYDKAIKSTVVDVDKLTKAELNRDKANQNVSQAQDAVLEAQRNLNTAIFETGSNSYASLKAMKELQYAQENVGFAKTEFELSKKEVTDVLVNVGPNSEAALNLLRDIKLSEEAVNIQIEFVNNAIENQSEAWAQAAISAPLSIMTIFGSISQLSKGLGGLGSAGGKATTVLAGTGSGIGALGSGAGTGAGGIAGLTGSLGGLTGVLGVLLPVIAVIIVVIATLYFWWDELSKIWNESVSPAIADLSRAFGNLQESLGITIDIMSFLKLTLAPVAVLIGLVIYQVSKLVEGFTLIVDVATLVIESFKTIGSVVQKFLSNPLDVAGWMAPLTDISKLKLFDNINKDFAKLVDPSKLVDIFSTIGTSTLETAGVIPKSKTQIPSPISPTGQQSSSSPKTQVQWTDENNVFADSLRSGAIKPEEYTQAMMFQYQNKPLALGGYVSKPLNALIGESGPEIVIPIENLKRTERELFDNAGLSQYFEKDAFTNSLIGSVPKLASGGIVSKPTLALIGESGDEAIVPLNQLSSFNSEGSSQLVNISVTMNIANVSSEVDVKQLANKVSQEISEKLRRRR